MSDRPHWTEIAERIGDQSFVVANPLCGLLGEHPDGTLLLPAWLNRHRRDIYPDGWWNRRLNLRNPLHWLPYLRSRLTRKLVWLDE